jgi:nucleotide-binding universal stress UspA family protein
VNPGIFSRILFPTDFSEHAKRTLDCIAGLPGTGEVILVHIVEARGSARAAWGSEAMITSAMRNLEEEYTYLMNQGVRVHRILRELKRGSIGAAIVSEAEVQEPSIIMLGARGKSIVPGIFMGSVSSHVLRYSPVHVLIMKYRVIEALSGPVFEKYCPRILSRVLCPTDFSPHSSTALRELAALPGIGELLLIHVVASAETSHELEENVRRAKDELAGIESSLNKTGISCRSNVRIGNPASEIARVAEEEDISLIGLSSYGRGWQGGAILGAVASEVARDATRPVLVLRTRLAAGDIIRESG